MIRGAIDAGGGSVTTGRISDRFCGIGSMDGKVALYDTANLSCHLSVYANHPSSLSSLGFDRTNSQLVTGCDSGSLWLWDIPTATHLLSLPGHRSGVTCSEFHPFGSFFVTASTDSNLKVWDPRSGKCVQTYRGHRTGISAISFSPHGKWIVSGDDEGTVKFWDISLGKCFENLEGEHGARINTIAFHPNDFFLMTGSDDKTAKLWSCEADVSLAVSSDEAETAVDGIVFRPDGSGLFVAHSDGSLREFKCDLEQQQIASVGNTLSGFWNPTNRLLDLALVKSTNALIGLSMAVQSNQIVNVFDVFGTVSPICTPTIAAEETPPPQISISDILESRLLTTRAVCALVNRDKLKEALGQAMGDIVTFTSLLNSLIVFDKARNCISVEIACLLLEEILSRSLLTLPYTELEGVVAQMNRLPFSSPGMIKKVGCRDSCDSANFSSTVTAALSMVTYLNRKCSDGKCMQLIGAIVCVLQDEIKETKFMRTEKQTALSQLIQ